MSNIVSFWTSRLLILEIFYTEHIKKDLGVL